MSFFLPENITSLSVIRKLHVTRTWFIDYMCITISGKRQLSWLAIKKSKHANLAVYALNIIPKIRCSEYQQELLIFSH
jgi:hypothetical protein